MSAPTRSAALRALMLWAVFAVVAILAVATGPARAEEGAPASPAAPTAPQSPGSATGSGAGSVPDLRKAAEAAARAAAPPIAPLPAASPAAAPPRSLDAGASILYPPRRDVLRFSHARHTAFAIPCARCHPNAATSRSAVDLLLPTEAACRDCHAIERAAPTAEACGKCHRGYAGPGQVVARVSSTPPPIKFSHAAHARTACVACHAAAPSAASAAPGAASDDDSPSLPTMQSCLSCHREGAEPTGCTACHLSTGAGRIDLSLAGPLGAPPSGSLADRTFRALRPTSNLFGDAHHLGFATDHKAAATRADRTCGACHDESYCADCHAGAVRSLEFHPANYLQVHASFARRAASECSTCHRQQSFCVACHERTGVATRAASEWTSDNAFHPAGWASLDRAASNTHAREARRNLPTCASCHREDDCLPCHSADAGGMRVSPHPRNWQGSAQCRALDRNNRRMCQRCHVTSRELGCDWSAR